MADTGKKLWFVTVRHAEDADFSTRTRFNIVAPDAGAAERAALACASDLHLRKPDVAKIVSQGTMDEPHRVRRKAARR
jgi:hypothetical protein